MDMSTENEQKLKAMIEQINDKDKKLQEELKNL